MKNVRKASKESNSYRFTTTRHNKKKVFKKPKKEKKNIVKRCFIKMIKEGNLYKPVKSDLTDRTDKDQVSMKP